MTSLGRSPLKPKESSARSSYPTAGDFAAELDAPDGTVTPETAFTTDDDEHYQIDVDEPRAKVSALSSLSRPSSSARVIVEPKQDAPERDKKVRPPREPRVKKEREPRPPRQKEERVPREAKVKAPKPPKEVKVKTPKPPKEVKVKTPREPKIRTGNEGNALALAAGVIGAIGLLLSVILAIGALLVALDFAQSSSIFAHFASLCDALVGPLKDVFKFSGINATKKQSLVGWGLGSMGYLLVGRFLQSVLQSRADKS